MTQDMVLQTGSAVVECGFMYDYELDWAKDYGTRWYRSKDRKSGESPFASYLMNKKWTMEEEFNNHMMKFQQVTASSNYFSRLHFIFQAGLASIEVGFEEEEEDDDPEPLRVEHFYFPLGTLLVGLLLSVFCLLAEIIFNCLRKSKTNVSMAKLEEPGVTQSTTESEVGYSGDVEDIEVTKV